MSGRSMHIWISCWPEAEKRLPNSLWTRGRRWRILSSEWKNISEESWKKLEKIVEDEMLSTEEIRGIPGSNGERTDSAALSRIANMCWNMIPA